MIFLHVSVGESPKKGGKPTIISNRMTPKDHQSTSGPYPVWEKTSGAM
jgi:hypothetical protein